MTQGKLLESVEIRAPVPAEVAETDAAEFYQTPAWCVTDLLDYGPPEIQTAVLSGARCVDPCAGHGRIPRAVNAWMSARSDPNSYQLPHVPWRLIEIRESARGHLETLVRTPRRLHIGDFFQRTRYPHGDKNTKVVWFNSPFTLTLRFVQHAFELYPDAHVASFQRQSFLGCTTAKRADWLNDHQPRRYEFGSHRPRPKCNAHGTDTAEYQWHVWLNSERDRHEIPGGHRLQPGPTEQPIQGTLNV